MHQCDGSLARTNLEDVATCFVGKCTFQHVGSRHFRVFCRSPPIREARPADCCVARASLQTRHFLIRTVKVRSSKPGSDKYLSRQQISTSVSCDMVVLACHLCSATRHFTHKTHRRDADWPSGHSKRASRNITKRLIFVRQGEDFLKVKSRLK